MLHEIHMFYLQNHLNFAGPKQQQQQQWHIELNVLSLSYFLTDIYVFL